MNTNSISKLALLGLAYSLPPELAPEVIATMFPSATPYSAPAARRISDIRSYNDATSRRATKNRKKNRAARAARKRNRG